MNIHIATETTKQNNKEPVRQNQKGTKRCTDPHQKFP